ncbi:hypothetical protein B0H13DRAFT_1883534 [Mycena leptocephala]|nr:hypothetical protein B0H13DRAFT_1883534 [Mycena leptocephala]
MSRKRKNETQYDFLSDSEDDIVEDELPQYQETRPRRGQMLQESSSLAEDGRTRHAARIVNVQTSPTKLGSKAHLRAAGHVEEPLYDYDDQFDGDEGAHDEDETDDEMAREARASDDPLRQWAENDCDVFLDEMLRSEGRGDHRYERCQVWNGVWFEKKTLKELGLRVQLGHWGGSDRRCPASQAVRDDGFTIIADDGVHSVGLDFCGCGRSGSKQVQLLRAQLFPATCGNPRTAATFSVLRRFQLLSFEAKCSIYHFYQSLARQTDNLGLKPPKFGNGATRAGTRPGECALLCPACPQPGKNLPENWKDVPDDQKFLYALFLAIDANFRLKRKDVSTEEKDPGLGRGWAFYGDVLKYMDHLAKHWDTPQEKSHCVAHDAVDKPDKEARGTASSGIGTVDCARHNMKRPNAVGDLQFGERYINMDYMFLSSVAGTELQRLFVSYDIACQWHINIRTRMNTYKPELHIDYRGKFITFLVPKFHLPAHIEACNLTKNVGQTEGEAPERGWANANPLAASTKEMGPGARRDTIDDHFNDWNHKMITALGRSTRGKVLRAVPEMVGTVRALEELQEGLNESAMKEWLEMAENWEEDERKQNPFETLVKDDHLKRVRSEMAKEAADREAMGADEEWEVQADMHITEFIAMGLQLEEQQRTLKFDSEATGLHPTDDQRRNLVERSSKLRRKITGWTETQVKFFPDVIRLRDADDRARRRAAKTAVVPGVKVQDLALLLPSAIWKRCGRRDDICRPEALNHEYRMRVGQANEALHEVRQGLLVRTHHYQQKNAQSRGNRANMRSQDKIDAVNDKIRRYAAQYRAARAALETLGPGVGQTEWEETLLPLKEEDVRGRPSTVIGDASRQAATRTTTSKKQKTKKRAKERLMSWIWIVLGKTLKPGEDPALNEALRIEWATTRARSMRWTEEVALLEEEMRRIKQFLSWRSGWWGAQVGRRADKVDAVQLEGDTAYARRQADIQSRLCVAFETKWADLAEAISLGRAGVVGEVPEEEDDGASEFENEDEEPVPQASRRPVKTIYIN